MKKFLAFVLLLFVVSVFTGCSQDGEGGMTYDSDAVDAPVSE